MQEYFFSGGIQNGGGQTNSLMHGMGHVLEDL